MEREILFRGQTRKYGEKVHMSTGEKMPGLWVYGGVLQGEGDYSIIYGYNNPEQTGEIQKYMVYTDTLGQYTGLTDKNRVHIFEGDVVKGKVHVRTGYRVRTGVIEYYIDAFKMKVENEYKEIPSTCEIVGNIYDKEDELND